MIKALYRNAGGDVEKAARGIVCIDEIDKIARKGGGPSVTRDVSGEGVQQALLKILEGKHATITPDGARNRPQQELIQIDTTNILDLVKYGMIPEFMGRLPIIVSCDALDVDSLTRVLHEPKNALAKQYQRLFELEGVKLRFTEEALRAIAEEAHRRKSGARGLRAIVEEVMLDVMYEIPSLTGVSECVVTREVVANRERPQLIRDTKKAS